MDGFGIETELALKTLKTDLVGSGFALPLTDFKNRNISELLLADPNAQGSIIEDLRIGEVLEILGPGSKPILRAYKGRAEDGRFFFSLDSFSADYAPVYWNENEADPALRAAKVLFLTTLDFHSGGSARLLSVNSEEIFTELGAELSDALLKPLSERRLGSVIRLIYSLPPGTEVLVNSKRNGNRFAEFFVFADKVVYKHRGSEAIEASEALKIGGLINELSHITSMFVEQFGNDIEVGVKFHAAV